MSWVEIKGLKEQHAKAGAELRALVELAEKESRALNSYELTRFDKLAADFDGLQKQIDFCETRNAERRGEIRFGRDIRMGSNGAGMIADDSETRALRSDESCRSYLEARGIELGEQVSAGALVRAAISGARNDTEKRALSATSDSAGGFILPSFAAAGIIDNLKNYSAVLKAGANTIPLISDRNKFARVSTDPTPGFRAAGAAVTEQGNIFESVEFTPFTLAGMCKLDRELLQDAIAADRSVEEILTEALALQLDRVALVGSGSGESTGIASTTGINSVSMGTNGAALTSYDKLLDVAYELSLDNAPMSGVVMHPRSAIALAKLADTTGQPLRKPDVLSLVPFHSSTALPINQTQGSASNASTVIAGDFRKLLIGVRTSVHIEILKERYADTYSYGVLYALRADTCVARPKSFCKLVGVIPA
jgi:HK97 family phage major capsid protein